MLQRPLPPTPSRKGRGSNSIRFSSVFNSIQPDPMQPNSNPTEPNDFHYSSTGFGSTSFAAMMEIS